MKTIQRKAMNWDLWGLVEKDSRFSSSRSFCISSAKLFLSGRQLKLSKHRDIVQGYNSIIKQKNKLCRYSEYLYPYESHLGWEISRGEDVNQFAFKPVTVINDKTL